MKHVKYVNLHDHVHTNESHSDLTTDTKHVSLFCNYADYIQPAALFSQPELAKKASIPNYNDSSLSHN
jgi:hypothetical protein